MQDLCLMSRDCCIAEIRNAEVTLLVPELLPLYLRRGGDIRIWLESRAIDAHRTNSRLLKRALRLEHKDDLSTVLSVNAATITDTYWVKPASDDSLSYEDVRYKMNVFDKLALYGDVNSFEQAPSRTPELTNTGSFEKCWRMEDGKWWMYKAGRSEELFSEYFAFKLGKYLGYAIADYEAAGEYIKSRDFTEGAGVNFEPAFGITGDISDYKQIHTKLSGFGKQIAEQYLYMCYYDALIFNMDRHENNFGVLRSVESGEVLSLAPLFDHNIALVARGYPKREPGDMILGDFTELLEYLAVPLAVRQLKEDEAYAMAEAVPYVLPVTDSISEPLDYTVRYILRRQEVIKERCGELIRYL